MNVYEDSRAVGGRRFLVRINIGQYMRLIKFYFKIKGKFVGEFVLLPLPKLICYEFVFISTF